MRGRKMNRKHSLTILATTLITTTILVSLLFTQFSFAANYNADNMTVNGVLATDSYVLYPYETDQSLIWGFSKYGEMINGAAQRGLDYRGMDVFANPNVLEKDWVQGWFIDIHWADSQNRYNHAWAFAMYSDLSPDGGGIGGIWKENCTQGPLGLPEGGRKTSIWASSDPIKVLYDGPRRFVGLTRTVLYATSNKTAANAMLSVSITFVFDKDKKCVVLFKDIKRLDEGKFGRTFEIEFSNRGEWDIGYTSAPPAYAHFYSGCGDGLHTAYNYDYHNFYSDSYDCKTYDMCQMISQDGKYVGFAAYWPPLFGKLVDGTTHIDISQIFKSLCTVVKNGTWSNFVDPNSPNSKILDFTRADLQWDSADYFPVGGGEWDDAPMVFKNGVRLTEGVGPNYDYEWSHSDVITFWSKPSTTDVITIVYKHKVHSGSLDMLDISNLEPDTPFVIGEWVFDLKNVEGQKMFRAVTVYGLVDRHDADDDEAINRGQVTPAKPELWSYGEDVIDHEVMYLLDQVFNPVDLVQAVEKQDSRWVDMYSGDLVDFSTTTWNLHDPSNGNGGLDDMIYYVNATSELTELGMAEPDWTGYYFRARNYTNTDLVYGTWVNTYEDGRRYVYDKNWAANLTVVIGSLTSHTQGYPYVQLKVTPSPSYGNLAGTDGSNLGFGPLGDLTFRDLVDFDFWYRMNGTQGTPMPTPNYGPHIEIKLAYNGTGNSENWVNLCADANPIIPTDWTHYDLNDIAHYVASGNASQAFYVSGTGTDPLLKDNDGKAILVGPSYMNCYENWTRILRDFKVLSVSVQLDRGGMSSGSQRAPLAGTSIAYVDNLSVGYLDRPSGIRYERVYNMEEDKLVPSDWAAYDSYTKSMGDGVLESSYAERVFLEGVLIPRLGFQNSTTYAFYTPSTYPSWYLPNHPPYYTIDFAKGELSFYNWSPTTHKYVPLDIEGARIKVLYSTIEENDKGRYEWIVVGKPAATVDALSTAYVSQAFDSRKDIHVMEAGMDYCDTTWGPNMPYVMAGPGTGTRTDYVDAQGRPGLKDDWCTTWPVASSDMIFMAGPRANLGTEYMNEFTNVFYPRSEYATNNSLGQANNIFALPCWNKNVYYPNATDGYGVISVHKDLNGTIGLVFWGMSAQDFYYTCQWFWSYPAGIPCPDGSTIVYSGIEYLQHENRGVTDIILHIDYTDATHPTVTVGSTAGVKGDIERIGTISEKVNHDPIAEWEK